MTLDEYTDISRLILDLEREGRVTRTFRRLDAERQFAVIRAIFDEAVESGPESINIKRVAERAGVAVGSLYQYFGSRDGLLDFSIELAVRAVTSMFETIRPYLLEMPLREALEAYGAGGMQWSSEAAGLVRYFARAAYGGDPALTERVVQPVAETMLATTRALLVAAQARGELREDLDVESAARVLHALTIALYDPLMLPYLNAYFQITGPHHPADRTLQTAIDIFLRGILPPLSS